MAFSRSTEKPSSLSKRMIDGLHADLTTDELKQFSRVIGEALKDSTILLEYKSGCSLLADAIIAVDTQVSETSQHRITKRVGY